MQDQLQAPRIEHLPPERWRDYKALRLEALRTNPDAFGARYESAIERPDDWWIGHLEAVSNHPNRTIFFATFEDRLVGMAGAYPEEDPRNVNIVGMYVTPSWRGRGVGRALLQAVVDRVQAEEVRLCVNGDQEGAVKLYESFGFVTISETPLTRPDGTPYVELYMALR